MIDDIVNIKIRQCQRKSLCQESIRFKHARTIKVKSNKRPQNPVQQHSSSIAISKTTINFENLETRKIPKSINLSWHNWTAGPFVHKVFSWHQRNQRHQVVRRMCFDRVIQAANEESGLSTPREWALQYYLPLTNWSDKRYLFQRRNVRYAWCRAGGRIRRIAYRRKSAIASNNMTIPPNFKVPCFSTP